MSSCSDLFLVKPSARLVAACVLDRLQPEMSSVRRLTFLAMVAPREVHALAPKELSAQYSSRSCARAGKRSERKETC